MTDTSFDEFFNEKLKDHASAVPAGLWEKVKDTQMDAYIGNKMHDFIAPIPTGLWEKINDAQFDNTIAGKLHDHTTALPDNLWDRIADGQFDDFIQGKFINHSAPVPTGLWEKVKPDEKDDRKGFILFRYPAAAVLLLALLLGGSFAAYYLSSGGKNNASATLSPNAKVSASQNNEDPIIPIENNSLVPGAITPSSPKNTNGQPLQNGEDNTVLNGTIAKNGSPFSGNNQPITRSNLLVLPSKLPGKSIGIPVYQDPFINEKSSQPVMAAKAIEADNGLTEMEAIYQSNFLKAVTIPSGLNGNYILQSLLDKQLAGKNHTNQFRNVIICPPVKGGLNTDLYLETYLSPDLAFKSVSNISASQQYLLRKDSSESMQVGFSGGIRLVKPLNENLLLKAGIQYTQMNEKYVYRTENEVKTTTVVSVRTIIRGPGDTVIVRDTSTLMQIGYKNNTVKNRFRSIDLPITIGYQFGNDDLKFGVNAGVIVNLSSWYQGVILDSSLATVPLAKDNSSMVYKSNIGLGLYGGISIVKKLSEDMHIFAEPYFRYNLSNMTNEKASFKQRFSLGGISVGLRFNLNRQ